MIPEWLQQELGSGPDPHFFELLLRICLASILGWVVSVLYRVTHRISPFAPTFPRTLVLLAILISMVTQVIGDNVARAFSLVGALSIVRFRTVVSDTQDTAFVIFAVVIGMASGAGHWGVALAGLGVVGLAVWILRPRGKPNVWTEDPCELVVRFVAGAAPDSILAGPFAKFLRQHETLAVATAKQGTAIEVTFRVLFLEGADPLAFLSSLNGVEGVQNVDLHRAELSR